MSAPEFPSTSGKAGSMPDRVRDDTADLAATAQQDLAGIGDEVKQQAAALGEEAKAQMGEMADKAKGMASEQKDLLAGQLGGVSEALKKVAGELEERDDSSAHYVRLVADNAQKLTSTFRDHDVDDILQMAQDFGRKQPAAFLGAAALLGFAASRFVMASASRRSNTDGMSADMKRTSEAAPSYSGVSNQPDYAQSAGGKDAGI